jgi:hypothetical protein
VLHEQLLLSVGYVLAWHPLLHHGKQGANCYTQPAKIIVANRSP